MRAQSKSITLLALLLFVAQSQFTTYIHNFDTTKHYFPTYDLGLLSPGSSI
jgi:hypothetical protein